MIKHILKYLLGDILIKIILLISLPVYTYFLTPQEYGIYSLLLSYVMIGTVVFSLNVHTSVGRFFYEKTLNIKLFLSTTIILTIITLFISTIILFSLDKNLISSFVNLNFELYGLYFILLIIFNTFLSIYTQTLIPQKKSKEYSAIMVTKASLNFFLIVVSLYFIEKSVISMINAILVAEFLLFLFIVKKLFTNFEISMKKSDVKYIFEYSIFLIPYALSGIILVQIDRVMLAEYLSTFEVGIYSVAYTLSMIPMLLFSSIVRAWTPNYFKYMDEKNYLNIQNDVVKILLFISFLILSVILFLDEIVYILLDEKYLEVKNILPLLSVSIFFIAFGQILVRGISYSRKTIWLSAIGVSAALLNIALNYYWIKIYNMQGAVYATLISYMFMTILTYYISKYYLKIYTVSISSLKYIFLLNIGIFGITFIDNYNMLLLLKILYIISIIYLIIKYKNFIYIYINKKVKNSEGR